MSVIKDNLEVRRSQLVARRAALSALQRDELDELLKKGSVESVNTTRIPKRASGETAPLSFAQERLWFLDQLAPESVAYNICIPFRITGRLNVSALEQTINEIVRRHEVLRTTFVAIHGRPVQRIASSLKLDTAIVDLEMLTAPQGEQVVQRLVYGGNHRPFNLAEGPLVQTSLFRLGSEEHVLMMRLHHIIFDAWSMQMLVQEAEQIYRAFTESGPSSLPELLIQYADFAAWQRQTLTPEMFEKDLAYWKRRLEGSPPMLDLPTDRPRPAAMSFEGSSVNMIIPEALTEKLKALSQAEGCTLFMTLLASFQMLLSRYTGQDDILVGTPVAGRQFVETEDLIGFFVNTLVIRMQLSGDPAIRTVLSNVREESSRSADTSGSAIRKARGGTASGTDA